MALDREPIYAALLVRLQTVPRLGSMGVSRRYVDLAKVQPTEQPGLLLITGNETAEHRIGLPAKWMLRPTVVLYARTDLDAGTGASAADYLIGVPGQPSSAPGTTLAALLTAVERAVEWGAGDSPFAAQRSAGTSLGDLCLYCRIASIDVGEGIESGQAMAAINLEILCFGAS